MYRSNVSMIVFRKGDGKFLLVHKPRKQHAWQFPQGGIDPGETAEQAVRRELKEELGTDKFQGFFKSQHVLFYDFPVGHDPKYKGQKQSYFLVEFTGEDRDITLNIAELDEQRWIYGTEFSEYIESQEYLKKINQVLYEFKDKVTSHAG